MLVIPATAGAITLVAAGDLGLRGAAAFGIAMAGWLYFARLLVMVTLAALWRTVRGLRWPLVLSSIVVDGGAVAVASRMPASCVWGTLLGIVISEVVIHGSEA